MLLFGLLAAACGAQADPVAPIVVTPGGAPPMIAIAGSGQSAPAGTAVAIPPRFLLSERDGTPRPGIQVRFSVAAGGGWVVDSLVTTGLDGTAAVEWVLGAALAPQRLRAITSEYITEITAVATAPTPGTTLFGKNDYVEYVVGDAPVILSAPHGGSLTPAEIPDRTGGTQVRDTATEELARSIAAQYFVTTGRRPHLIISRLHRKKLDPNREVVEAAEGQPAAIRAWREYQHFLEVAHAAVSGSSAHGLLLDVHGHGHPIARLEWGYLFTSTQLSGTDIALNGLSTQTSMRMLSTVFPGSVAGLVRGPQSLGALLEARGYPSVPSPTAPAPGTEPYFSGGYLVERHGSRDGGTVNAVQLETNFPGIRDSESNRARFAVALVDAITVFLGLTP